MPARLIVNADDFGLTAGVNRAISELHVAGVLTSATLMASGSAFEDAVEVARRHPGLGVGCHVVLTDGVPVSPPESIPSLLGPDERSFRPELGAFLRALLRGDIRHEEIEREALAQITRLKDAGLAVTHVDSHKHTHLFPSVTRPVLEAARRTGVTAVREPFEPGWSMDLRQGSWQRRAVVRLATLLRAKFEAQPAILAGDIRTTNGTLGISGTGNLEAGSLAQILRALPESGTYELCCHPGYNDADLDSVRTKLREHREVERDALLEEIPRALGGAYPPELVSYAALTRQR